MDTSEKSPLQKFAETTVGAAYTRYADAVRTANTSADLLLARNERNAFQRVVVEEDEKLKKAQKPVRKPPRPKATA